MHITAKTSRPLMTFSKRGGAAEKVVKFSQRQTYPYGEQRNDSKKFSDSISTCWHDAF